jgi:hypothetical protein
MGRIPDRFAVMAVDPGGATGVACGIFDACETLEETLQLGEDLMACEVAGSTASQAWALVELFREFMAEAQLAGIPRKDIHLVFEAFDLRTVVADLAPVEVIAGVRTLFEQGTGVMIVSGVVFDWRSARPGDAKKLGTSVRLGRWGLFELGRGSDHKRDALRHLALRVARILEGRYG